jgi:hypothetical protein
VSLRKLVIGQRLANARLASLDPELAKLYEATGRESIPPEWLLRASLLQAFYSIRSERQLMEQLDYNLLVRGAGRGRYGLGPFDLLQEPRPALEADVAAKFQEAVLRHPKVKRFLSDEHFSVDGTRWSVYPAVGRMQALIGPKRHRPPTAK